MTNKRWQNRARVVGRKAYASARKRGLSIEQASLLYSRAYSKVWGNSSKEKARKNSPKEKLRKRRWWKSPSGKNWQKLYSRNALETTSKSCLRKALSKKDLLNGWPDAGRIEQKIGRDHVRPSQWLRAAWAFSKGIVFKLLFSATHEDAAINNKYKIISFKKYAKQLGLLKEWNSLVEKMGGNLK